MSRFSNTLFKGSFTLLIAFNIFNILNFLYQFAMARVLTIAEYGALASVLAVFSLVTMPSDAIQNTITKYATFNQDPGKLKNIFKKSVKRILLWSSLLFVIFLILALPLSGYMKVGYAALIVGSLMIFANFLNPVTRGILLGEKKFGALGWNVVIEGLTKVVFAVVLILIFLNFGLPDLKIYGAIIGAIASTAIAFFACFFSMKDILFAEEKIADVKSIYDYLKPAFFVTLAIFAFMSVDIIIAKIVFDPETAGSYAIASMVGKIIFFGISPISRALFPMTSAESKDKKRSDSLFMQALGMMLAIILVAIIAIVIFPHGLIMLFSGKEVPLAGNILFYEGLAAGVTSLTNLILYYKLSIGKTKGYLMLGAFLIVEVILLFYFSSSLIGFALAFLSAAIIFLIGSIVLAAYEKR